MKHRGAAYTLSTIKKVTDLYAFLTCNTFVSNARLKLANYQGNAKHYPELNVRYLSNIHILHSRYHPKIIEKILKNKQKSQGRIQLW